ncbi:hypothetical protein VP1G_06986 [Cytospora mali]|uniref:DUF5672 domain-containing protein n=1 Tax=Cytospora mali TaxID=578113 RepID=A0A194V7A2_CYTMA|nr:hypothetical protein VP1G_06986 [Valsa mali var. pyri (nom. inval.)]
MNPPPPPPPPPPPAVPFPDNVAVIMETDPNRVPNLFPVMLHFANILGPKWPVVLLTLRSKWVEPASPAFKRYMAQRRIHIHFLPEGTAFPDHNSVSLFLTRPWFWEKYESAGRVLMFQADSVLCGRSGRAVDDFLEWDLIGAPISGAYGVGYNGGLSLRNPRLMLEVLRDPANSFARDSESAEVAVVSKPPPAQELKQEVHKPEEPKPKVGTGKMEMSRGEVETRAEGEVKSNPPAPAPAKPSWMKFEDQWFYMKLKERGARLPDQEVAKTFSVETIYYDKPLGYHQPFRWLNQIQKKQAMEWCPEIGIPRGPVRHRGRFGATVVYAGGAWDCETVCARLFGTVATVVVVDDDPSHSLGAAAAAPLVSYVISFRPPCGAGTSATVDKGRVRGWLPGTYSSLGVEAGVVALLVPGVYHPATPLSADQSPFQPPPTPELEGVPAAPPDLTTSSWLVGFGSLSGNWILLGSVHTGGGSTPILTAISLGASGLGPPTLALVSEFCCLVLSSNLVNDQGRASLTEAGGGLGPLMAPVVTVPTVEAAMAAACCVCEFGLWWRDDDDDDDVDEAAETRREMLSSEVTSGIMFAARRDDMRQVTRLGGL